MAPVTIIQKKPKSSGLSLPGGKGGLMSFPGITAESSRKVSELIKRNHYDYDGFFSDLGYNNHVSDDLLATYDFGATPSDLDTVYNRVKQVQRPSPDIDSQIVVDLLDESQWHKHLGVRERWSDFLTFFQNEMEEIGVEAMLNKRLFAGTEASDDLLARCFSCVYHPIIRIGYGLEFGLPGIVSAGLALGACGSDWTLPFFKAASDNAKDIDSKDFGKPLLDIIMEIQNDPVFRDSGSMNGEQLFYPIVIEKALDQLISYSKQYQVPASLIDEKTAESANISALVLGGSMRKDKEVRVDFLLLHCVTTSIFMSSFNSQDFITSEWKARLLEWKTRFDIITYAAVGAPVIHKDEIENYKPKVSQDGVGNPWLNLVERAIKMGDDGHTIKMIRALAHGEKLAARYGDELNLPVTGTMWRKIAAMSIDNAEGLADCLGGRRAWVRGAGFDYAWDVFGPRLEDGK